MSKSHEFVLILDENPIGGHLFGDLKLPIRDETREDRKITGWVVVERRCRLCDKLPIELLTKNWGLLPECDGVRYP